MAVEKIRLSEKDYKRLYDEQKEKIEYLEEFIGDSTIEQIKQDKNKIEELSKKVIEQDKQIAVLSSTVKEKDKHIESLRTETDKRIEQEVRIAKQEKDNEYKIKLRDKGTNERRIIRNNEVKPLQAKYEALLEHIGETTDRTDKNVLMIIDIITNGFDKVQQLIIGNKTQEEIKEEVEQIKKDTINKINKDSIAEECEAIHNLLEQGKTQKEIATILYPDLARREVKVSDRINSKTYQKLYGVQ